ncbi:ShlB/FhaC/HecB family hemolysin secretion/activation protein [Helicobacter apodemus]|uniref:Hemolysin activator protein n=1 Tax=Helicobacter apodemus TaxID=135569 RepID=A0A2U8FAT6_9HELI|nr:ShlB/FhaC/HecB family hemolysin secretion/activation protein [Helicobacter apodemus]AWI33343.1 hemolysin activator protein [Helicobacter apodemus]AWI33352.1 hemolysin activator protein [Helicobacter apodemus]
MKLCFLSLVSNTPKLLYLFFGLGVSALEANLSSLNQSENRRIEQEKLQKLEESFIPTLKASPKAPLQNQEFAYPIEEIAIIGNTILSPKVLQKWRNQYKLLKDIQSLQKAIHHLENLYLNKGYINTRIKVDLSQANSPQAKLTLRVLEGKIDKYLFNDKENLLKSTLTFPRRKNQYFNIYDIDQGVDNLSNLAKISINPSSKLGYSIVNVETPKKLDLEGKLNYNNLGQSTTGKARARISLNSKDFLGLNESLLFYYQQRLNPKKTKNNAKNYILSLAFPFGYYHLGYSYENSHYKQELYALNRIYTAQGDSTTQNLYLSKVLYRDGSAKLDLKVNLALKKIDNLLDNYHLTLSSRRLSVISMESSYLGRIANGLMSASVGLHQGLKHFKANKDNEWYRTPSTPEAKFLKYSYSLSWYKPFNTYYYKIDFSGQFTKDILYSNEKLYIGDDTTIRGFQNNGLQGDKGFYLRNELGINLKHIKPFIAYDRGRIKNSYGLEDYGRELQGISVGAKIIYKSLEASLTFSRALKYPKTLLVNGKEIYTSITWNF